MDIDTDNSFESDDEALDWIICVSFRMLKIAHKDSRKRKLKPERHQKTHLRTRHSALRWVFVPDEAVHPLFTFDNVCKRLKSDPYVVRKQFFDELDADEQVKWTSYHPGLYKQYTN